MGPRPYVNSALSISASASIVNKNGMKTQANPHLCQRKKLTVYVEKITPANDCFGIGSRNQCSF